MAELCKLIILAKKFPVSDPKAVARPICLDATPPLIVQS